MIRDGWNHTLAALLICVFFYSVAMIMTVSFVSSNQVPLFIMSSTLNWSFETLCHWIVTETYLKVSHEAKTILGRKPDDRQN
jgi:uncharacterized membrane protein